MENILNIEQVKTSEWAKEIECDCLECVFFNSDYTKSCYPMMKKLKVPERVSECQRFSGFHQEVIIPEKEEEENEEYSEW